MKIDLKKSLYTAFASALIIGGFASSSKAAEIMAPSSLANSGQLTYAVAATFAPFEYMENGKLTGFDIDMINEISKRMGLETNPMNMELEKNY